MMPMEGSPGMDQYGMEGADFDDMGGEYGQELQEGQYVDGDMGDGGQATYVDQYGNEVQPDYGMEMDDDDDPMVSKVTFTFLFEILGIGWGWGQLVAVFVSWESLAKKGEKDSNNQPFHFLPAKII